MSDQDDGLFSLTRRQVLGSLGIAGVAGAIGGAGTASLFSDSEAFNNNQLVAGTLNLKVGWDEHYSDWSADERQAAPNARVETNSSQLDSANETGLPTQNDPLRAVPDTNITAFLDATRQEQAPSGGFSGGSDPCSVLTETTQRPAVITLSDVKPGDFGEITFSFALCDNPGLVWLTGNPIAAAENGNTEPEANSPAEGSGVELLDATRAAIWVDDGDNYQDDQFDDNGPETILASGSLRDMLGALSSNNGILLDGDGTRVQGRGIRENCFSATTTHYVGFAWWVPLDVGNQIQSDSVEFNLGFYAEQCRNNSVEGWVQTAKLTTAPAMEETYLGSAVGLGSSTLVVGADGDKSNGANAGVVYVFENDGGWTQTAQLRSADGSAGDYFGEAVDLDAETVVVGAPGVNPGTGANAGAAYIFEHSNGAWTETAQLTAGGQGASFGQSVAIAGQKVAIGADGISESGNPEVGGVYLFNETGNGWNQTTSLRPATSTGQEYFGVRTALDATGDRLVVSAYGDDRNGDDAGVVYVFDSNNGWTQTATLTASDASPHDYFGSDIAIHDDTIVVGAFGNDSGGTDAGAAYVFTQTNDGWSETAKLTASDGGGQDFFGWLTAVHSNTILVGAYREDSRAIDAGAAYVYQLQDGAWTEISKLTAADASDNDRFGVTGDLRNDQIVVAATGKDVNGPNSGALYLFQS